MTSLRDDPPVSAPLARVEARRAHRREATARRRRRRRRRLIAAPFLALLLWAIASYTTWMLKPTSMTWTERSVEWVRHEVPFGNWIVDNVEHVYYTLNAPQKGGPQLKALPAVGVRQLPAGHAQAARRPARASSQPSRIKPIFPHRLPGEGVWRPTGPPLDGGPPVLVTTFRTELDYPRIVAYVAWFDHSRIEIAYVEVVKPEGDRHRRRLGEHAADRLPSGGEQLIRAHRAGVGVPFLPAKKLAVESERLLPVGGEQLVPADAARRVQLGGLLSAGFQPLEQRDACHFG